MTIGSLKAQDFSFQLMDQYAKFKESSLSHRRFKHEDMQPLIEALPSRGFRVEEAGKSYLGRRINLISIGEGETKVLLWSQMHGNEATATMALFDIFNFLGRPGDEVVQQLLSGLTLYFIPMLNPDGAEVFQRRTAQGIDMNRDALELTCPESGILQAVRDRTKAHWGFNLHDQNIYYNVGTTEKPATISFLAPAYNRVKEVNAGREDAMKVIAVMNESLQAIIPGQVGKYDDTHEPRAFGDNIQKWGTRTILIESGGFLDDPEKQFIRQLNFVAILTALRSISTADYLEHNVQQYLDIPLNDSDLNDLIIRNIKVGFQDAEPYFVDIAVRREEFDVAGKPPLFYKGSIEDLGDLSTQYGYQEINEQGLEYAPGKLYPEVLRNQAAVQELGVENLLQQGYLYVRVEQAQVQEEFQEQTPNDAQMTKTGSQVKLEEYYRTNGLPFDLVKTGFKPPAVPKIEQPATFLLMKDGHLKYAVINGFVHDVDSLPNSDANGWVYQ